MSGCGGCFPNQLSRGFELLTAPQLCCSWMAIAASYPRLPGAPTCPWPPAWTEGGGLGHLHRPKNCLGPRCQQTWV